MRIQYDIMERNYYVEVDFLGDQGDGTPLRAHGKMFHRIGHKPLKFFDVKVRKDGTFSVAVGPGNGSSIKFRAPDS